MTVTIFALVMALSMMIATLVAMHRNAQEAERQEMRSTPHWKPVVR